MENMLINASQSEEIRVALVKDNHLYDLDIECPGEIKKKGNIYKAIVTRREPSLDAVFVEYGARRQGFLPIKEIAPEYFNRSKLNENKSANILALHEGQELLIQVDKEERGNKGAALTTFITLAGCYLVLMPNSPRSGGISRRIEGDDRDELKETLNALNLTEDMGLIIRTAGVGKSHDELQADLDLLVNQWHAIKKAYHSQLAPCLIHQEGDVIIRSIRDNLRKSINEIIIDDQSAFIKAKHYIEQVKPSFLPHLKLYNSSIPLFTLYQIESQIETAFQRQVPLPSGGALVIDRTEALVSIDINSAKATSGSDIETTAVTTNLEAADEIARQLRLRDLGGLVVIDFIDMSAPKNQRDVESRLKEALKADRARIQVGRISRFGLLEMSRQRLRLSLGESAQEVCPKCEGRGTVRNIHSNSLSIIRLIEEEALREKTAEVQVQLPVDMATLIMNEKRTSIEQIQKRHGVNVVIVANPYLQSPQYLINRVNLDNVGKNKKPSYSLVQQPDLTLIQTDSFESKIDRPYLGSPESLEPNQTKSISFLKQIWQILRRKITNSQAKTPMGRDLENTSNKENSASLNGSNSSLANQQRKRRSNHPRAFTSQHARTKKSNPKHHEHEISQESTPAHRPIARDINKKKQVVADE